ncbi:MAG: ABC transporter ATP-binding protein [Cytophagales bacterium]|nr:MAG: ABC transporter ATP-binding protein [Cytophagales bacterium]TAG56151.1 MAG: ABC transporter ATP-binding protein [Cytophagales bacterium]
MIQVEGLKKSYNKIEVLKGVNLDIKEGEIVAITGASGAGKSTLLQILGTLDKPDTGNVMLNNENVFNLSSVGLAKFRNKTLGFIFQFHNLLPEFNALENVILPAYIGKMNEKKAQEKGKNLLELVGLSHRIYHKPSELSGGEQQRVAVARALINDPKVIFADEPSGNLDSKNAEDLHQLFLNLKQTRNQTFVIVTHNLELAKLSDRWLKMKDGLIFEN